MILKLEKNGEISRISVDSAPDYQGLLRLFKERFGEIPEGYSLRYVDDAKDIIRISDDIELREAIRLAQELWNSVLKIEIYNPKDCPYQKKLDHVKNHFNNHFNNLNISNRVPRRFPKTLGKVILAIGAIMLLKGCCGFILLLLGLLFIGKIVMKKYCKARKEKKEGRKGREDKCHFSFAKLFNCGEFSPRARDYPVSREVQPESNVSNSEAEEIKIRKADELPFQSKMKQLEEMGFLSQSKNIEVLIKNRGDVLKTVKDLLEKSN